MRRLLQLTLFLLIASTGWAQDSQTVEHLFKAFYYDKDSIRIVIPENEHASTKLTGFMVHKAKIVLLGDKAKTELTNTDDIFIEVMDTLQLKPHSYLRRFILSGKIFIALTSRTCRKVTI